MRTPIRTICRHVSKDIIWEIVGYTENCVELKFCGGTFFKNDYFVGEVKSFNISDIITRTPNEYWVIHKSSTFQSLYQKLL